jgi:hypothetical protein
MVAVAVAEEVIVEQEAQEPMGVVLEHPEPELEPPELLIEVEVAAVGQEIQLAQVVEVKVVRGLLFLVFLQVL